MIDNKIIDAKEMRGHVRGLLTDRRMFLNDAEDAKRDGDQKGRRAAVAMAREYYIWALAIVHDYLQEDFPAFGSSNFARIRDGNGHITTIGADCFTPSVRDLEDFYMYGKNYYDFVKGE